MRHGMGVRSVFSTRPISSSRATIALRGREAVLPRQPRRKPGSDTPSASAKAAEISSSITRPSASSTRRHGEAMRLPTSKSFEIHARG